MRISFFEKRRWNNFANVIPMVCVCFECVCGVRVAYGWG